MKIMKVKKASIVARGRLARALVFTGRKAKTVGGLRKESFIKNSRNGKIVGKAGSARSKRTYKTSALKAWGDACKQARKQLGITGFCAVGGKTAQGQALYSTTKYILASKAGEA